MVSHFHGRKHCADQKGQNTANMQTLKEKGIQNTKSCGEVSEFIFAGAEIRRSQVAAKENYFSIAL